MDDRTTGGPAFGSMKVVVSALVKPVPVLKLRHEVPCTEEFRTNMDSYLRETFGEVDVFYQIGDGVVVVSEKQYAAMLRAAAEIGKTIGGE